MHCGGFDALWAQSILFCYERYFLFRGFYDPTCAFVYVLMGLFQILSTLASNHGLLFICGAYCVEFIWVNLDFSVF